VTLDKLLKKGHRDINNLKIRDFLQMVAKKEKKQMKIINTQKRMIRSFCDGFNMEKTETEAASP